MVFSFFKKQTQKMPERPAARPRSPELRPEVRVPKPLIVDVEPLDEAADAVGAQRGPGAQLVWVSFV